MRIFGRDFDNWLFKVSVILLLTLLVIELRKVNRNLDSIRQVIGEENGIAAIKTAIDDVGEKLNDISDNTFELVK